MAYQGEYFERHTRQCYLQPSQWALLPSDSAFFSEHQVNRTGTILSEGNSDSQNLQEISVPQSAASGKKLTEDSKESLKTDLCYDSAIT